MTAHISSSTKCWGSIFLLFVMFGFAPKEQPSGVKGTWELISYKYGDEQFFSEVPNFMRYTKIITTSHYHWAAFGEGDELMGAGGGTYTLKGDKYTESADFFYPHSSGVAGTSTTFTSKLKGNTWTISGTIRSIKINPETGKKEQISETKMAEVWQRVEY